MEVIKYQFKVCNMCKKIYFTLKNSCDCNFMLQTELKEICIITNNKKGKK